MYLADAPSDEDEKLLVVFIHKGAFQWWKISQHIYLDADCRVLHLKA